MLKISNQLGHSKNIWNTVYSLYIWTWIQILYHIQYRSFHAEFWVHIPIKELFLNPDTWIGQQQKECSCAHTKLSRLFPQKYIKHGRCNHMSPWLIMKEKTHHNQKTLHIYNRSSVSCFRAYTYALGFRVLGFCTKKCWLSATHFSFNQRINQINHIINPAFFSEAIYNLIVQLHTAFFIGFDRSDEIHAGFTKSWGLT